LVPIYLGKREDRFDPAKLSALLMKVKNSTNPNSYHVLKKDYEPLFRLGNPIITILVDLAVSKPGIVPVESFASNVFAFTVRGAGDATYNCFTGERMNQILSMNLSHTTSNASIVL